MFILVLHASISSVVALAAAASMAGDLFKRAFGDAFERS